MKWTSILQCPLTGKGLRLLTHEELLLLNEKIAAGQLQQADGSRFTQFLSCALCTEDQAYIYPIINEIILLLGDFALLGPNGQVKNHQINSDKRLVRDFYDQRGWHTDEAGNYEDAVIFEDLRDVSRSYLKKCHDRVARFLNPSGKYLLDAASGALQFQDYLQYSEHYDYRVCVDLSYQALSEVKRKLGPKAICVLCDMTNMPFRDGSMDGFISLNTIYHIPKDEQATAIRELYRLLAPKGKGVVVYDWYKHSPWMNVSLLPFRGFAFLRNKTARLFRTLSGKKEPAKMLYFYTHPYAYFKEQLPPFKLRVWRSVSVPFMKTYVHPWLFGRTLLNWLYTREEKDPESCGRNGEYPMFIFEKG